MVNKSRIKELVLEKLEGSKLFPVSVQVDLKNRIFVEIDGFEGVAVSDCVGVSRHIESSLDRENEDFELNVSSPGIGKAFKVPQQYLRHLNKDIKVILKTGETFVGELMEMEESESLTVACKIETKTKNKAINNTNILVKKFAMSEIAKTMSHLTFSK